ncbi:hypothetical protein VR41_10975 [Streptomyces sp. NRRL B-1568]|nr:hypothetical protein VR41_10975 [Streptomyces sp. NRRL B-1568]
MAGLTIDVALAVAPDAGGWNIDLPYLRLDAGFLRSYGCTRLLLVLSAAPGADGVVSTVATVGADLPFAAAQDAVLRLRTLPAKGAAASTWTLSGDFSDVVFSGLGALAELVPGADRDRFALPDIPGLSLPAEAELAGLSIVFSPDPYRAGQGLDPVLTTSVRVRLPVQWSLLPGVFENVGDVTGASCNGKTPAP